MTHHQTIHAACAELGIKPPLHIAPDGCIKRFGKDKSHWYVDYGGSGCVGTYKGGFVKTTYHQSSDGLTNKQQRDLSAQIALSRAKQQREQEARYTEGARAACEQWNALSLSGVSEYLTEKRVRAHGVRFGKGFFAIPLRDEIEGDIYSLQFNYDDHATPDYMKAQGRNKTFVKNGRKHGCFHFIGSLSLLDTDGCIAIICEGYATGASLHLATGLPVFVAFDCGNLAPVVKRITQLYPKLRLAIAADDDRWKDVNAGVEKAHAAADTIHSVVLPHFASSSLVHKPTDFNDLHVLEGLHKVKAQWQQAIVSLKRGSASNGI